MCKILCTVITDVFFADQNISYKILAKQSLISGYYTRNTAHTYIYSALWA